MTIKIDLPPEIEAVLAVRAAARRVTLTDYLRWLLEEQVRSNKTPPLSAAERVRFWRESAEGMPYTPPLPDEAVSRESFYDARG